MNKINKTLFGLISIIGFSNTNCLNTKNLVAPSPPNIILIMVDDMGTEWVGCYGNIENTTPNIDRLASQGVLFENCYAQPLCTPSRVKIMTGKYNFRNYEDFGYLNPDEVTFGNLLQKAGYTTCVAGKWQLNGLNRKNPGNQDVNRPYHFGFGEYCLWQLNKMGERYAKPLIIQNGKELPVTIDSYGPDIFSDYVCDFIKRKKDNPFFVYYPMVLIHEPFVPTPDSPEWENPERRYEKDTMYISDMVKYVDKIVLKIENTLKKYNLWENTILIFTCDNGTSQKAIAKTKFGDIAGGKGKTINTGIHVPMIISWPEKIKKNKIIENPVDFADILPTLADVAGISPELYSTDGISLYKILNSNNELNQNEIFIHYTPRWAKFEHTRFVMNNKYKLYQNGEFYNFINDPKEKNPLLKLTPEEKNIMNKFDLILKQKENEFPFKWNDKEFAPPIN